jgi:hypothetical protein
MGGTWTEELADLTLAVPCRGAAHELRWSAGRLRVADHADLDAEAALAALGTEPPPCVDLVLRWRQAVRDGGFLLEWADADLDDPVYRHQVRIAVNRLRIEGVQDLLRGLPPRRAEAMGEFLLRFPGPWVDRAALAVVRSVRRLPPDDLRWAAVERALQVRARGAFVRSLTRWSAVTRPAALVRFRCVVGPWDSPPAVAGVLRGPASWCHVSLSPRWLLEVWGPGHAVDPAGDLVLSPGRSVAWVPGPDGLTATLGPNEAGRHRRARRGFVPRR